MSIEKRKVKNKDSWTISELLLLAEAVCIQLGSPPPLASISGTPSLTSGSPPTSNASSSSYLTSSQSNSSSAHSSSAPQGALSSMSNSLPPSYPGQMLSNEVPTQLNGMSFPLGSPHSGGSTTSAGSFSHLKWSEVCDLLRSKQLRQNLDFYTAQNCKDRYEMVVQEVSQSSGTSFQDAGAMMMGAQVRQYLRVRRISQLESNLLKCNDAIQRCQTDISQLEQSAGLTPGGYSVESLMSLQQASLDEMSTSSSSSSSSTTPLHRTPSSSPKIQRGTKRTSTGEVHRRTASTSSLPPRSPHRSAWTNQEYVNTSSQSLEPPLPHSMAISPQSPSWLGHHSGEHPGSSSLIHQPPHEPTQAQAQTNGGGFSSSDFNFSSYPSDYTSTLTNYTPSLSAGATSNSTTSTSGPVSTETPYPYQYQQYSYHYQYDPASTSSSIPSNSHMLANLPIDLTGGSSTPHNQGHEGMSVSSTHTGVSAMDLDSGPFGLPTSTLAPSNSTTGGEVSIPLLTAHMQDQGMPPLEPSPGGAGSLPTSTTTHEFAFVQSSSTLTAMDFSLSLGVGDSHASSALSPNLGVALGLPPFQTSDIPSSSTTEVPLTGSPVKQRGDFPHSLSGPPQALFPPFGDMGSIVDLKEKLYSVWRRIHDHRNGEPFHEPVRKEDAPKYHDIIKNPMDLATIKNKLDRGEIVSPEQLFNHLALMFQNALTYNARNSQLYKMTLALDSYHVQEMKATFPEFGHIFATRASLPLNAPRSRGGRPRRGNQHKRSGASGAPGTPGRDTGTSMAPINLTEINSPSSGNNTPGAMGPISELLSPVTPTPTPIPSPSRDKRKSKDKESSHSSRGEGTSRERSSRRDRDSQKKGRPRKRN